MDKLNRKILAELQKNGKISLTELSEKIGISLSPCQRRVKQMEQSGIITGYHAQISHQSVGLYFEAMVFVKMNHNGGENIREFEQALQDIEEIIEAKGLLGDPDFMLHIVTKDVASFQNLYSTKLTKLPHVSRLSSTMIMNQPIKKRMLPINMIE